MQLRYTTHLIAEAGGDPWAVNSLQVGRSTRAVHDAGRCTAESSAAIEAVWNRRNGVPIIDSAEVQRVIESLGAQSLQLPKIGADMDCRCFGRGAAIGAWAC